MRVQDTLLGSLACGQVALGVPVAITTVLLLALLLHYLRSHRRQAMNTSIVM